jgi:hypothetical protein
MLSIALAAALVGKPERLVYQGVEAGKLHFLEQPSGAMAMFGQYSANAVVAYVAANGSNDLLSTAGEPGGFWTTGAPVTGQSSALPPALAFFNGNEVLAFVANNGSHDLLVTTSNGDGSWTTSTPVTGQSSLDVPRARRVRQRTRSGLRF